MVVCSISGERRRTNSDEMVEREKEVFLQWNHTYLRNETAINLCVLRSFPRTKRETGVSSLLKKESCVCLVCIE